jgi:hypothetical protein
MNQNEIIEMARQAGFVIHTHKPSLITVENEETWVCVNKELEAFAKLVAAKEREALVLLLRNLADDHTPTDCADMICALQSLRAIRARGEA